MMNSVVIIRNSNKAQNDVVDIEKEKRPLKKSKKILLF